MPWRSRIGVVAEGNLVLVLECNQPRHGVRTGAIHADLAVVVHRHERKGRIDSWIHHRDVELVDGVNRRPVVHGSAAQRVDRKAQVRSTDRIHVDDISQVLDVGHQEVFLAGSLSGRRELQALYARVACAQQRIRPVLDPMCNVGVGRPPIRRIVFKAAILRRIVRRRNDNAIGEAIATAPVVHEDRARDRGCGRVSVVPLDDRVHAVGGKDFERRALGRCGDRMGPCPCKVVRSSRARGDSRRWLG